LGTFEQIIEQNGSENKELLERKIGGKKSKIGAALIVSLWCTIHSDQGVNLCSTIVQSVSQMLGIATTGTSAYHPDGNGKVAVH